MSTCEICGNKMINSHYHIPIAIKELNRIKFAHPECCSVEDLKQCLATHAHNQIKLYQDVIELIDNMDLKRVKEFEAKYGTYEEIQQGQDVDHQVMISALISELRRRLGSE